MIESNERVEEFKQEIGAMKVRDPSAGRDRVWLRIGIALMVVGLGVAIGSYFMSHGTSNALSQNDAITMGIAGLAATVVGAALFVRYSVASFLRFWMARFIYEQQSQTDRIVEKLDR
jgi:TRAP-type C4-dicarboxylate transport system permease small subunit